jgi:hypothetical protein
MMRSGSLVTYIDRIRPAWRIGRGQPGGQWGGEDWAEVVGVEGFRVRVWTRLEEREKEEVGSGVPVRCGRKQAGRRRERRGEQRD